MARIIRHPAAERRILRVAARLFRAQGFTATTVREIANAARILPGSLHYRFPSKELLLIALMEKAIAEAIGGVLREIAESNEPVERLRLGLRAHLRILLSGDDAMHVLLYEWRSLKGKPQREMIRLRDKYEGFWDSLIREAAARHVRKGVDLKLLRLFSFGAINWAAVWYSPGGGRSPEEIADAFWTFMGFGVFEDASRLPRRRAGLEARPGRPQPQSIRRKL